MSGVCSVFPGGWLFVGRAPEKTALFLSEKSANFEGRALSVDIVKTTGLVNHYTKLCLTSLRHLCDTELRIDLDDTSLAWKQGKRP